MAQVLKTPKRPYEGAGPIHGKADFLFEECPLPPAGEARPDEVSARLELPYGVVETTSWYLDGIRLLHRRNRYNGHYLFLKQNADEVVNLTFNLKGACRIHHLGKVYPVQPLQHNMIYSPGTSNMFTNSDLETETFSIQFTPETFLSLTGSPGGMLGHFAGQVNRGLPSVLARESLLLDAPLQKAIYDIRSSAFAGRMQHLFLLSKSMEILVMQTDAFLSRAHQRAAALKNRADHQRIRDAERYLLSRVSDPPSLRELAQKVGINEYKLKRGFREVFGHTVFGYLMTHRLIRSRQMLLDTPKTAAEIAFELGFSSPQHFNNAFKKQFGIPPKQFVRGAS